VSNTLTTLCCLWTRVPPFWRSGLSIRNDVLMDYTCPIWRSAARSHVPMSGSCKCCNPSGFALRLTNLGTLVTGKFTRIWGPPLFGDQIRALTQSFDSQLLLGTP
jgi:hypothetical protein